MSLPLRPYPNSSEGLQKDEGSTDWRLFLSRLIVVTVLVLFLVMLLFGLALVVTAGQINEDL